ncbi:MAG: hypothetical protein AB200_00655 [Parcubacteria bacterium C7867-005]|nr:MAG: hypothetical protein AB200_00655 [Parcubacteria bacterium C7867-005]
MVEKNVLAQENPRAMELKSITVGSGRDAIASGIVGTAIFNSRDGKLYGDFTVQAQQSWLTMGRNFGTKTKATIGGTIGYFQGAPFVGPYVFVTRPIAPKISKISVSGLYWPAVFAWEPSEWKNDGVKNPEPLAIGNFGMVSIGTDRVRLTYALLDFMDDPFNRLPGISISAPYAKKMVFNANATWNTVGEEWMFYMGMTWSR